MFFNFFSFLLLLDKLTRYFTAMTQYFDVQQVPPVVAHVLITSDKRGCVHNDPVVHTYGILAVADIDFIVLAVAAQCFAV
jgi:hypothetical protein